MKKIQMSKFWIAIAVVAFGGVCLFLPKDMSQVTTSVVQAVDEPLNDTVGVDTLVIR